MSSVVSEALVDLAGALDGLGVAWYLFGAQAAILYGSTRVTEDIDVTVALGALSPGSLVDRLVAAGFKLRVPNERGFVARTRVLPLVHERTSMPVDVVLAGPGLEEIFFRRVRTRQRGAQLVPVASAEDLVVMKLLASRPHDLEDVRSILRAQGAELDAGVVVETLAMLEEALGQADLVPAFERLRQESSPKRARVPKPTKRKTGLAAKSKRRR